MFQEQLLVIFKSVKEPVYNEKNDHEPLIMSLELLDATIFVTANVQSFYDKAVQKMLVQSCYKMRPFSLANSGGDKNERAHGYSVSVGFILTGFENE